MHEQLPHSLHACVCVGVRAGVCVFAHACMPGACVCVWAERQQDCGGECESESSNIHFNMSSRFQGICALGK